MVFLMSNSDNYLFISDLQIPFQHEKALSFCVELKREFDIPDENIYNIGDEVDQYWGSMYKKCPDAVHSPTSELEDSRMMMRLWYEAFPSMKLCESNHGNRWKKKALDAEIPSVMLRRYQEILACPPGWEWRKLWRINSKYPMCMEHGEDHGGSTPHLSAAIANGCSTVIGHHHSIAGIEHLKTNGMCIWGMATGSLIDFSQYAFNYARGAKRKPLIGCGVVLDGGRTPIWLPLPE